MTDTIGSPEFRLGEQDEHHTRMQIPLSLHTTCQ